MSKKAEIEEKTEALLIRAADENNVKVYDVEYVKEGSDYYLRCYIDKESGVTIDDCEKVSRAMSDMLDRDDFIDDPYILEVSSPGLGRVLKKDRHLEYSLGEEVEIKLFKSIDESKNKEFSGILDSFDENTVTILLSEPEKDPGRISFDRKNIAVIRLALDF